MKLPSFVCGEVVRALKKVVKELEDLEIEDLCPSYTDAKRVIRDVGFWEEKEDD